MIKWIGNVGWTVLLILLCPGSSAVGVPRETAGIVLGDYVDRSSERLKMDTDQPIRYQECYREIGIGDTEGFKSGAVWYGTSTIPDRIVGIKPKYNDSRKAFFDTLLNEFGGRVNRSLD